jgi:hypothetical protein
MATTAPVNFDVNYLRGQDCHLRPRSTRAQRSPPLASRAGVRPGLPRLRLGGVSALSMSPAIARMVSRAMVASERGLA